MDERQLSADELVVRQAKTGAELAMSVTGELADLLDRIAARKRGLTLRSKRMIVDADGLAIGRAALRYRFDQARKAAGIAKDDFQFRDLRAKAGTDKARFGRRHPASASAAGARIRDHDGDLHTQAQGCQDHADAIIAERTGFCGAVHSAQTIVGIGAGEGDRIQTTLTH
ncbi:hypothetical protein [Xanthomonas theicola]|uniref:hypothetical protein n=1 Tax=Xanthomonas theicola TaxID=56464 RepID=UPI001FE89257|nr:hypothetical protein [Xanthomonas theicola]